MCSECKIWIASGKEWSRHRFGASNGVLLEAEISGPKKHHVLMNSAPGIKNMMFSVGSRWELAGGVWEGVRWALKSVAAESLSNAAVCLMQWACAAHEFWMDAFYCLSVFGRSWCDLSSLRPGLQWSFCECVCVCFLWGADGGRLPGAPHPLSKIKPLSQAAKALLSKNRKLDWYM